MPTTAIVGRPYRSKVYRPCDRCRRRKTACALPADGACQSCSAAQLECTFAMPPAKRQRSSVSTLAGVRSSSGRNTPLSSSRRPTLSPSGRLPPITATTANGHGHGGGGVGGLLLGGSSATAISTSPGEQTHGRRGSRLKESSTSTERDHHEAAAGSFGGVQASNLYADPDPLSPHALAAVQHVCSLDQLDRAAAQLCGMSAELDPWLLRHCRFNEFGMRRLHNTHIRNVGGVPLLGLVPVHFTVPGEGVVVSSPGGIGGGGCGGGGGGGGGGGRTRQAELDRLVPRAHGPRLVALFLRFVYPMMPIVSRSQLRQQMAADAVPTLLLAALYASALPYVVHEPALFIALAGGGGVGVGVGGAVDEPGTTAGGATATTTTTTTTTMGGSDSVLGDALWRLVYELVQAERAAPKLVVLQASLLYLQRLPGRRQWAQGASPVRLSFLGSTVALAMSLGLQLEPQPWGIPGWEKRLRRCLWWAVYAEDKWTSLLLGRPPLLRASEWDVLPLQAADLEVGAEGRAGPAVASAHAHTAAGADGAIFLAFLKLAQLAEAVQETFYSLRASQLLAEDFRASIDAARPIREALQAWYSQLPPDLRLQQSEPARGGPYCHGRAQGVAALHFCYLTLELFLYRAILRPLARSPPPPPILERAEAEGEGAASSSSSSSSDEKRPGDEGANGGGLGYDDPWMLDDLTLLYNIELDQLPVVDFAELGAAAEATLNAAAKCAGIIVSFVATLVPSDFDVLWYPWTRIAFATVTNFIVLLLVQAPSPWHAARAKELLDRWAVYLQRQHKSHEPLMTLGLVRLHGMQVEELDRMFLLSPAAQAVLGGLGGYGGDI